MNCSIQKNMNELIKQPSYTVGKLLFTASPPPFCTIQFPVSKLARFRLTQESQPLHLTRWKISFGFLDLIISKNNRRTDHSEDWWFFQTRTEHSLVKRPALIYSGNTQAVYMRFADCTQQVQQLPQFMALPHLL